MTARTAHAVQWLALTAAWLLTVATLAGCGGTEVPKFAAQTATAPAPPKEPGMVHATEDATVIDVRDGATLDVQVTGGQVQRIRLFGVAAPSAGECGRDEATRHLRGTAPVGSPVQLTTETAGDEPPYDGSGRYVRAGGRDLGSEQVMAGWARVAGPAEETPMLDVMQADAQAKRSGVWGPLCGRGGS